MKSANVHIINGSAHDIPFRGGLVHCVVTSPPY